MIKFNFQYDFLSKIEIEKIINFSETFYIHEFTENNANSTHLQQINDVILLFYPEIKKNRKKEEALQLLKRYLSNSINKSNQKNEIFFLSNEERIEHVQEIFSRYFAPRPANKLSEFGEKNREVKNALDCLRSIYSIYSKILNYYSNNSSFRSIQNIDNLLQEAVTLYNLATAINSESIFSDELFHKKLFLIESFEKYDILNNNDGEEVFFSIDSKLYNYNNTIESLRNVYNELNENSDDINQTYITLFFFNAILKNIDISKISKQEIETFLDEYDPFIFFLVNNHNQFEFLKNIRSISNLKHDVRKFYLYFFITLSSYKKYDDNALLEMLLSHVSVRYKANVSKKKIQEFEEYMVSNCSHGSYDQYCNNVINFISSQSDNIQIFEKIHVFNNVSPEIKSVLTETFKAFKDYLAFLNWQTDSNSKNNDFPAKKDLITLSFFEPSLHKLTLNLSTLNENIHKKTIMEFKVEYRKCNAEEKNNLLELFNKYKLSIQRTRKYKCFLEDLIGKNPTFKYINNKIHFNKIKIEIKNKIMRVFSHQQCKSIRIQKVIFNSAVFNSLIDQIMLSIIEPEFFDKKNMCVKCDEILLVHNWEKHLTDVIFLLFQDEYFSGKIDVIKLNKDIQNALRNLSRSLKNTTKPPKKETKSIEETMEGKLKAS